MNHWALLVFLLLYSQTLLAVPELIKVFTLNSNLLPWWPLCPACLQNRIAKLLFLSIVFSPLLFQWKWFIWRSQDVLELTPPRKQVQGFNLMFEVSRPLHMNPISESMLLQWAPSGEARRQLTTAIRLGSHWKVSFWIRCELWVQSKACGSTFPPRHLQMVFGRNKYIFIFPPLLGLVKY